MVLDSNENIVIGGHSDSATLFGMSNQGFTDFFVVKFHPNITFNWAYFNGISHY